MILELPSEEHKQCAVLLEIMWQSVPRDYKKRYVREIWRQFQEEIESSAYETNSLARFVNSLSARFGAIIASDAEMQTVASIITGGNDRALMKLFREDTLLLVLAVRCANQERKEEWKARQAERRAEEEAMAESDFGLPKEGRTE